MSNVGKEPIATIRVTVKVFGALRNIHRQTEEIVALEPGQTVGELLQHMREANAPLVAKLEEGLADGYLSALINGRNIRFLREFESLLKDGDTVAFLPPVGGG